MSKDYIEKEAALTELNKVCDLCMALVAKPMCGDCSVADTVRKIKRIPPADVKPVVRGEWETVSESAWDGNEYKCSACGWTCCDNEFGDDPTEDYRFCPNCGADMRKEANDERES